MSYYLILMFLLVEEKRERKTRVNRDSMMKVDKDFHRKLKTKASEQGMSIMELTRLLSEREEVFNVPRSNDEKTKKPFKFRI